MIYLCFLIGFIIKYNYLNWQIFQVNSIYTLITKNIVVILFSLITANFLLKDKNRIYISFFFYLLFTSFFFANLWYNKYFSNYLSVADITMGQGIRPFKVLFRQLISYGDLFFIFEIPILLFLLFYSSNFKTTKISMANNKEYRRYILVILLIIMVVLAGHIYYTNTLYAVNGFLELYEHSTPAFVSVYGILPLYAAEYFSIQSQEKETVKQITDTEIVGEEDLSQDHQIEDIKNIIVIQLESFDQKIIDYSYNNKEVTPFLNKLKDNSLYFDNIYAQHVNGSFDAEFSFLTSLYPRNKNYAFKTNDMSEFNSIVKVLKKRNYQFLAFHGNNGDFFYRDKGYPELGFDKFYDRENFQLEKAKIAEESYLGINDYDFFDQSIAYLEQAKEPFFAFYITVSSHTPFDFYPDYYSQPEFENLEPLIVKDYFNSVHFTDQSIKNFFEKLKANNLYEDTLFVFYSDHSSDIKKEAYSSGDNFIMQTNVKEPENIPLMIFHPELESKIISKTGTQTDIAPTILDILGDKEKPKGFLGVSLLKEEENPVLFLHEMPQILYHQNVFVRLPMDANEKNEFSRIGYKNENQKEIILPESEKERMVNIINYMQEIMKKNISEVD
jgi:phosphoglycerol transferase MdoB-like AlkP superfamily enzyme